MGVLPNSCMASGPLNLRECLPLNSKEPCHGRAGAVANQPF
jgi:hypothetical protein